MCKKKKFITVILMVFIFVGIFTAKVTLSQKNTTNESEPVYIYENDCIEYKGNIYHSICFTASPYDFTQYEMLSQDTLESIYSLKGDVEENFLYRSMWQDSVLYSRIENFEEIYPFGEYKEERVTGIDISFQPNFSKANYDYYSSDKEFIELMLNLDNYSDKTTASYPLKGSSSFTASIYVYEDNLPISGCNLGNIAYYQDKWIFVDKDNEIQGELTENQDTRTYVGIEINDPYAVNLLNKNCGKIF